MLLGRLCLTLASALQRDDSEKVAIYFARAEIPQCEGVMWVKGLRGGGVEVAGAVRASQADIPSARPSQEDVGGPFPWCSSRR